MVPLRYVVALARSRGASEAEAKEIVGWGMAAWAAICSLEIAYSRISRESDACPAIIVPVSAMRVGERLEAHAKHWYPSRYTRVPKSPKVKWTVWGGTGGQAQSVFHIENDGDVAVDSHAEL